MGKAVKDTPEVLTIEEAAEFLRLSKDTVYSLAAGGLIPARKVGASWRILRSALEDWLRGGYEPHVHRRKEPIRLPQRPGTVPSNITRADIYSDLGS